MQRSRREESAWNQPEISASLVERGSSCHRSCARSWQVLPLSSIEDGTQHCYFAGSAGIVRVLCAPFVVWMRYPSCPESQTSASTYTVKYSV